MSRIHEALKRVQQELDAAQGNHAERSGEPAANPTVMPVLSVLDSIRSRVPPAPAPKAEPLSLDALREHCPLSKWSPDTKTMLFFNPDEQAYGSEQFRTLRSRLYQLREQQNLKKVLVTSALPKEGKSFVAANLAQAIVRQQGRSALLIDADLRAPRLHSALGAASTPGLSEYLLGEADVLKIVQRGPMEDLFFIPSGREVSNPAELLAGDRLPFLLQNLEPIFDWIIIDSPPAVPVTDAGLLGKYCDGVLLVVRSNLTPFDAAQKARDEFSDKHLLGIVFNGIGLNSLPYTRYYYSSYVRPNGKQEKR